uniref:Uncharacterized protein n=1 Tax=Rhizophora mucronata TaxID=61149 RepID=A0A2P2IHG6_RHIMU
MTRELYYSSRLVTNLTDILM